MSQSGLPNIPIALWHVPSQGPAGKIATDTTGSNGGYTFYIDLPGQYFVEIETEKYVFGPIVQGGNQFGQDGRSPTVGVTFGKTISLNGGLYLPFSSSIVSSAGVSHCKDTFKECGWGLWNKITCQVSFFQLFSLMLAFVHDRFVMKTQYQSVIAIQDSVCQQTSRQV